MDVNQLKQLIQQYFLNPLNNLPITQIKLLDTNHDQSVRDFQNAIGALFPSGGPSFEGKTADAVAEYVGTYLNAEEAFSPYAGNGLSDHINMLLRDRATALEQIEPLLKALHDNAAWAAAAAAAGTGEVAAAPEELGAPPTIPLVQLLILIGVAVVFVWASADQQNQINHLTEIVNTWITEMQTLVQQSDPPGSQLPGPPSKITTAITFDIEQMVVNAITNNVTLTPQQEQLAETLGREYGIPADMVAALISLNPTATEEELRAMIKRYLQLRQKYPFMNEWWLLFATGFKLSDSAVAYLSNLGTDSTHPAYLKGQPLQNAGVDLLTAVLGSLTDEASAQIKRLIELAKRRGSTPLDQAIPGWNELPPDVRRLLEMSPAQSSYGRQYGRAIESLVKQLFSQQYPGMLTYYENEYDVKFNKGFRGLFPDVQIILSNGQTVILDITSAANIGDKAKYVLPGVDFVVVLTY